MQRQYLSIKIQNARQYLTLKIDNAKTISYLTNTKCKDYSQKLSNPNSKEAAKNKIKIFRHQVEKLVIASLKLYLSLSWIYCTKL